MDLAKEQQQRKEFCDILFELAKSQELLQNAHDRFNMYKRLEALYYSPNKEARFRHFYSDIFTVLTQIQQNSKYGDINILGQNLSVIRSEYIPKNNDENGNRIDISYSIQKLYDHVNLDIARISYSDAGDRKTSGEETISELQSQLTQIKSDVKKATLVQEKVEEELGKQQKEYIAILGIFASVVLAFTGGIAFSTSVLNNIAHVSAYRTILIALLIGLVLINILFGLFFYINKIVSKEEQILPLIISNVVILILIILTVLSWYFGCIEKRNEKVDKLFMTYEVEENISIEE